MNEIPKPARVVLAATALLIKKKADEMARDVETKHDPVLWAAEAAHIRFIANNLVNVTATAEEYAKAP